jgi:hypothetical protein
VPGFPALAAAFDGFAEIWFDSLEDVGREFTEPRYLEIIRPDEERFIDLPNCKTARPRQSLGGSEDQAPLRRLHHRPACARLESIDGRSEPPPSRRTRTSFTSPIEILGFLASRS